MPVDIPKVEGPSKPVLFGGELEFGWEFGRPQSYRQRNVTLMRGEDEPYIVLHFEDNDTRNDSGKAMAWPMGPAVQNMFSETFERYFLWFAFLDDDNEWTRANSERFAILNAEDTKTYQQQEKQLQDEFKNKPSPPDEKPSTAALSTKSKIGIGAGAGAFTLLLFLLILACFMRRRHTLNRLKFPTTIQTISDPTDVRTVKHIEKGDEDIKAELENTERKRWELESGPKRAELYGSEYPAHELGTPYNVAELPAYQYPDSVRSMPNSYTKPISPALNAGTVHVFDIAALSPSATVSSVPTPSSSTSHREDDRRALTTMTSSKSIRGQGRETVMSDSSFQGQDRRTLTTDTDTSYATQGTRTFSPRSSSRSAPNAYTKPISPPPGSGTAHVFDIAALSPSNTIRSTPSSSNYEDRRTLTTDTDTSFATQGSRTFSPRSSSRGSHRSYAKPVSPPPNSGTVHVFDIAALSPSNTVMSTPSSSNYEDRRTMTTDTDTTFATQDRRTMSSRSSQRSYTKPVSPPPGSGTVHVFDIAALSPSNTMISTPTPSSSTSDYDQRRTLTSTSSNGSFRGRALTDERGRGSNTPSPIRSRRGASRSRQRSISSTLQEDDELAWLEEERRRIRERKELLEKEEAITRRMMELRSSHGHRREGSGV